MYRPFFELLAEDPINISIGQQLSDIEVLSSLKASIKKMTVKNAADLMESYFIDLCYGTDFGLKLAGVLLEIDEHDGDSLGFICTYLSYYPECDGECSNIRNFILVGDNESAKELIFFVILSLK